MAYYCGECAVWAGSSDVDRYGRRWCSYSRRYEESNQNTYGCRGFVYNGRTVLTKVCEILDMPKEKWFKAFDSVKDSYVAPYHMEWLTNYCTLGPQIADALDTDFDRYSVSTEMMNSYIKPAYVLCQAGMKEASALKYRELIHYLAKHYGIMYVN